MIQAIRYLFAWRRPCNVAGEAVEDEAEDEENDEDEDEWESDDDEMEAEDHTETSENSQTTETPVNSHSTSEAMEHWHRHTLQNIFLSIQINCIYEI